MKQPYKLKNTAKQVLCLVSILFLVHCGGSDGIEIPESTTSLTQEQAQILVLNMFLSQAFILDKALPDGWNNFDGQSGTQTYDFSDSSGYCGNENNGVLNQTNGSATVDYDTGQIDVNMTHVTDQCEIGNAFSFSNDVHLTYEGIVEPNSGEGIFTSTFQGSTQVQGTEVEDGLCGVDFTMTYDDADEAYVFNGQVCQQSVTDYSFDFSGN